MGGLGSGGSNRRWRGAAEGYRRLSANTMQQRGVFQEGWSGRWGWSAGDETTSWIWVYGGPDEIRLNFNFRQGGDDWKAVDQTVILTRVAKPFGNSQPYFFCPQCGRRALHLYGSQPRFLCRTCSALTHASSRERSSDRALRQARKIRRRLGAESGFDYPAFRPKHMRQATYDQLYERLQVKEAESWDDALRLLQRFQKSEQRISRRRGKTASRGRGRAAFW